MSMWPGAALEGSRYDDEPVSKTISQEPDPYFAQRAWSHPKQKRDYRGAAAAGGVAAGGGVAAAGLRPLSRGRRDLSASRWAGSERQTSSAEARRHLATGQSALRREHEMARYYNQSQDTLRHIAKLPSRSKIQNQQMRQLPVNMRLAAEKRNAASREGKIAAIKLGHAQRRVGQMTQAESILRHQGQRAVGRGRLLVAGGAALAGGSAAAYERSRRGR